MMDFVSIIVPCRNEKKYIAKFLDSLIAQNYPKDHLEILIADGMSEDGTREIIASYQERYPYIQLLDNPKKYTPSALNIAIRASRGQVIVRLDSHAKYANDYISKCVAYLARYEADNVGGTMHTTPSVPTVMARSIALCMSHGVGVGNSYFRKGSVAARKVDTVFGGCFKRKVFEKIGFFNENLARSQDLDFNLRLAKAGGTIMLIPDIVSYYYPKPTFREFLKHNFTDGQWAILPFKFTGRLFKPRHYALLGFMTWLIVLGVGSIMVPLLAVVLLLTLGLYAIMVLWYSLVIAIKEKEPALLFYMPVAFFIRHFGYGVGSLVGVFKLFKK